MRVDLGSAVPGAICPAQLNGGIQPAGGMRLSWRREETRRGRRQLAARWWRALVDLRLILTRDRRFAGSGAALQYAGWALHVARRELRAQDPAGVVDHRPEAVDGTGNPQRLVVRVEQAELEETAAEAGASREAVAAEVLHRDPVGEDAVLRLHVFTGGVRRARLADRERDRGRRVRQNRLSAFCRFFTVPGGTAASVEGESPRMPVNCWNISCTNRLIAISRWRG